MSDTQTLYEDGVQKLKFAEQYDQNFSLLSPIDKSSAKTIKIIKETAK